jgi:hypothetical protein
MHRKQHLVYLSSIVADAPFRTFRRLGVDSADTLTHGPDIRTRRVVSTIGILRQVGGMDHEIGNAVERYGSYCIHEAISTGSGCPVGYFVCGPCLPVVDVAAPCSLDTAHRITQAALASRVSMWANDRDWNRPRAKH